MNLHMVGNKSSIWSNYQYRAYWLTVRERVLYMFNQIDMIVP